MIRFLVALIFTSLAACGVNGPPLPPQGAVEPVAEEGIELTGELEAI